MRSRRGLTLAELVLALGLSLIVGGLVHRQLLQGRRVARASAERAALQENVRSAILVLAAELGPLGRDRITPEASAILGLPAEGRSDLLAIAPGAVTYRAVRGSGVACQVSGAAAPEVLLPVWSWAALRAPRASDSLVVFVEGNPATASDDSWLHLAVTSAAAGLCPGGAPALAIRTAAPPGFAAGALGAVLPGAPVRLVEVMQARYYPSGGKSWLGLRSVSTGEAITPLAGPLADSTATVRGLTLRYSDGAGAATSDPAAVRTVEVGVLGVSDQPIHRPGLPRPAVDSFALTARIALRNALGP